MIRRNTISGLITEADWQQTVVDLAELEGWWVWHDYDSRRNRAGFPDLVCVRDDRLLFLELKRETGRLTPAQEAVLGMLNGVTKVRTQVIRPSDFLEVREMLR